MDKESEQLLLFNLPNPLPEKLGDEFFQNLPTVPGVYRMYDSEDKIIYIGQSKNLKQRLYSYRSIKAEKSNKRMVRLVNAVNRIAFETCNTQADAIKLENTLIREFNPRYNRAQVYPYKNPYLICRYDGHRFNIRRQSGREQPDAKADELVFGTFPAGMTPRALRGWQRLLILKTSRKKDAFSMPDKFMENLYFKQLTLNFGRGRFNFWIQKHFISYLRGKHRLAFWLLLISLLPSTVRMDKQLRRIFWKDIKNTYRFFNWGPRRNRKLNFKRDLDPNLPISQDNLSDWQIEEKLS